MNQTCPKGLDHLITDIVKGGFLGITSGLALAEIFGSKNDTTNYTLFWGNKRVYDGIAYTDRLDERLKEHVRSGKQFTDYENDYSVPRVDALRIEKKRIKKHRPKYNIIHKD